jgi:hypothetical protein
MMNVPFSSLNVPFSSLSATCYRAVRARDGWRKSAVFGAAFRLTQTPDPLGHPAYALEVR